MSNHSVRWAVAVRNSDKPAYLAIADTIAEDIQSGKLAANQKLPPLRALAKALKLNFTTVARGYAEAQRRGLIDARAGHGTVVREIVQSGPVRRSGASLIDMTMNMPPEPQDRALLQRMREGLAAVAAEADLYNLLRYHEFGGSPEEREAGARWLTRHLPGVTGARVLVCPGVQSALLGLFSALARAGDTIACEAVTYPGIKGLAAQLGIRLIGLPADDEGLDPEAFAALCAAEPPKALYCNPTFLNPTTAVMSQARREAVAEIARRALAAGCDGVVSSGLEVARLRAEAPRELIVVTPGIRPVDNRVDGDQKRVMTPARALQSGADYLVVGRPIRDAADPRAAAQAIQAEIAAALA